MVEWVKYSAYGIPFGLPLADTNSDGLLNSTDVTAITNWGANPYDVRADPNLDGVVNGTDRGIASSASPITLGWSALSDVGNRKGYAGYEHAPELANSMWHVRNRVMISELLGRWITRDPIGYAGGLNLYEYIDSNPIVSNDPFGLAPGDGGPPGGGPPTPGGGRRPVGEPIYPPSYYAGPLIGCGSLRSIKDPVAPPGSGEAFSLTPVGGGGIGFDFALGTSYAQTAIASSSGFSCQAPPAPRPVACKPRWGMFFTCLSTCMTVAVPPPMPGIIAAVCAPACSACVACLKWKLYRVPGGKATCAAACGACAACGLGGVGLIGYCIANCKWWICL